MGGKTVTVIAYFTGDPSIYLSSGGGFIGAEEHESNKKVINEFIKNRH